MRRWVIVLSKCSAFRTSDIANVLSFALTVADALDEPRGTMDTSDPKDASGQGTQSAGVERSETLFGYSRRSEEQTDAEGADVDVSALE
jgi:hypothetical protein